VFVPATPACECRLFRVQHNAITPSHALVHVKGEKCMLVPLGPMVCGAEITFDYFAADAVCGGGLQKTHLQWKEMEKCLLKEEEEDLHPDLGFTFAQYS